MSPISFSGFTDIQIALCFSSYSANSKSEFQFSIKRQTKRKLKPEWTGIKEVDHNASMTIRKYYA